ncbi:MAG: PA2169 family four-helix-bundle protein [Proteobacteria bacterium]|nr:PA2169 family four-helix-bundle protein [Pseudomonadota bacterium]
MTQRDALIKTLNDLTEVCKDGEYGFHLCAEHAKARDVKASLEIRSEECRASAIALQAQVADLGGTPESGGTARGALHRGWVAIRSALARYDDLAMLEECERGEDIAVARYADALAKDLPVDMRALVEAQYQGVQRNHAKVKAMRDALRAAT